MNRILHIAWKDFRYLSTGIAGCYGLILIAATLFTLAARGIAPSQLHPLALETYLQLCFALYVVVSSVVLVRSIQGDSLVSSTAFWLTRPISRPPSWPANSSSRVCYWSWCLPRLKLPPCL
jgi:hypothetical protein